MAFSRESVFKYVKLVLVHPAVEITIEIIYLVTTLIIGYIIFKESSQYDNHDTLDIAQSYINYNDFNQIKTPTQFKAYLEALLDKLFILNPSGQDFPLFYPISPIRVNYFENENECNEKIDYTKTCTNSANKFDCVIDNFVNTFKYKCGLKYDDSYQFLNKKLKGYYSSYNLKNNNTYLDITRQTYYSTLNSEINDIIENKSIKAIILQINLKTVSNFGYVDLLLGIEMTHYFTNVKKIFSFYRMNNERPSTNVFLYVSLIFLIISVFFSTLKLIYEMNVKCIYSIHLIILMVRTFDIIFIITCISYMAEDRKLKFEINLLKFESHIKYINIIWILKIFFSILTLFLPLRLVTLISWVKSISELLVSLLNILFRMLPGIMISFMYIILFFFIFSIINYFLFNDIYPYYETMYESFIAAFNINIIQFLYDPKLPSKIFNNLFLSKYCIFFIFFQLIVFFITISMFIATSAYVFKQAILFQQDEEKDEYMEKLNEIQKKLEEKKNLEEINNNDDLNRKQILWFCLDRDLDKVRDYYENENYEVLFFKNTDQIISFIKYVFTMKPKLQHIKLRYKLNIVVETNQNHLEQKQRNEINKLTDWLIFIECKISLIFYGKTYFDSSYREKLKSLYKYALFVNNKNELVKYFESDKEKTIAISSNEYFTLGNKK